jgi:hypothetical protein
MNKIPKYKTKANISQPYIKVTKKETLDKTSAINKLNLNENNNKKKIGKNKIKFSNKDSTRKFGDDVSLKIKNSISPNVTHYHQARKTFSNINIEEKVNNYF